MVKYYQVWQEKEPREKLTIETDLQMIHFSVLLEMNFNIAVINMFKVIGVKMDKTRYLEFISKTKYKLKN